MGRAPAGPDDTYLSIEGGFLHQEGGDVIGYGVANTIGGPVTDITVSPTEGWFAGAMIGHETGHQILPNLPFTRIEGYILFGDVDDSQSAAAPAGGEILLKAADGDPLGTGGSFGSTSVERRFFEGGLRFEGDDVEPGMGAAARPSVTWVLSPFIRWVNEDSETSVPNCCATRSADVDTWAYGALLALEPELPIANGVTLVGRGGVGIYGFNADGSFQSSSSAVPDLFAASYSDSESGVGFRGQLGAGLKFWMSQSSILDLFAEADYFSDIGTAGMADNQPTNANPSVVDTEDLWEVRLGGRLTINIDNN
ncbi:MAG: hypothetical protein R3D57_00050 [Hyphomicrobiaceae bacterium]